MTVFSDLVKRTFKCTFKLNPRPKSFADSMQVFETVQNTASKHNGRILHYFQHICPVTKERLEMLEVVIDDPNPGLERGMVVYNDQVSAKLTKLEESMMSVSDRLVLTRLRRFKPSDPLEDESFQSSGSEEK